MTLRIAVETIPHAQQRYPTAGDYWWDDDGTFQVRISDLGDWRKELLLAVHELIEMGICRYKGIEEQDITDFDIAWEKHRAAGLVMTVDEPGNDPAAPYFNEHGFASAIERICAFQLGVNWIEYNQAMGAL